MAEAVYILCMLTSLACTFFLGRAYWKTRTRMLLWCGLCFAFLTINNLMLFLDVVVFPTVDLGPYRDLTALVAMSILVFGLIWDAE